jgi:tyrosyl-tRNA synthetase
MDAETRASLISREPTEEVITSEELAELLKTNEHPVAYDGFEPSGMMHIGSALMRAIKVQDMLDAGCEFILWVADYHALVNNKYGGDLEKIQTVGKYFAHGWASCGVDLKKVQLKWVSEAVKDPDYWKLVIQVARSTTIARMTRCGTIMGRKEGDMQETASLFYPAMQVADIFHLGVDICQLGMDQRKANILARELSGKLGRKKPVAVHHHMLAGLTGPSATGHAGAAMGGELDEDGKLDMKMSKSKPQTSIYIHDSPEEIAGKLKAAYCPEKTIEGNGVLEICRYIIFRKQKELMIERPEKFGGNVGFASYPELEKEFISGKLHPMDLKGAVANSLSKILEPSRRYFETNGEARDLLEKVRSFQVTR